ncbi:hypothetical protein ACFVTF_05175 [Kitasatospora sp. NPDC057940]|uniref:hypothetical protein n=1 Tax=Kitasatospora sp. NPDC057940 TaxID=3346285 RepID=UPI0036DAFD8F
MKPGERVDIAARMVTTWIATWTALVALFFAPLLLPHRWWYYIYSPASMGLWMLAMLVGPFVACTVSWEWIRHGTRKAPADRSGT